MLTLADATRLARILGMLGSRTMAKSWPPRARPNASGRAWACCGMTSSAPLQPKPERDQHNSPSWQDHARFCREHSGCLNDWEREFLASIMSRWSLTKKQHAVLDRLVAKCREYATPYA